MRLIILGLLFSLSCSGTSINEVVPAEQRCSNALDACIDLEKNLTYEVDSLKEETKALEERIDKEEENPLPWWVYVLGGGLVGYGAARTFSH